MWVEAAALQSMFTKIFWLGRSITVLCQAQKACSSQWLGENEILPQAKLLKNSKYVSEYRRFGTMLWLHMFILLQDS